MPSGFPLHVPGLGAEETNHPREVVEAALARVDQNKVEAAYARSDLFERPDESGARGPLLGRRIRFDGEFYGA